MDRNQIGRIGLNLVLAICIAGAGFYATVAVRSYLSHRFFKQGTYESTSRAVSLQPSNASYHALLSSKMLLVESDPVKSIEQAKTATLLNSYNAANWLDLALAYHDFGHDDEALIATRKAIAVDPTTPDVAWRAGNMFLLASDPTDALEQFAIVLQHSKTKTPLAVDLCWRVFHSVNTIEKILPQNADSYLAFLHTLTEKHETEAAKGIWASIVANNYDFDFHRGLFYVNYLLGQKDVADATTAWNVLLSKSKTIVASTDHENLVFDPSVNQEILNAGFDWHYEPIGGVTLSLVDEHSLPETHSLCVIYDAANGDAGFYQNIPVDVPGRYTLTAMTKSDNIQTANGPSVTVRDAFDGTTLASTPRAHGTSDWQSMEQSFSVGSETKLITIAIRRDPPGTMVKGQFCMKDPAIRKIEPAAPISPAAQ